MFGHSMGANTVMQTILSSCVQSDSDRVAVVLWSGGYVELDAMDLRLNQPFVVWFAYGDKDRYVDVHKLGRQSKDEYQRLFLNRTIKFLQDGIYQSN
jgi:actin-related protein